MQVQSVWDDDIMAPAFWGFVRFASKELIGQFEADNGGPTDDAQVFVDWCVTQFGRPEDIYQGVA